MNAIYGLGWALAAGSLAGGKSDTDDNEIASIIENINNMLNTKRDYGFFARFWFIRPPSP